MKEIIFGFDCVKAALSSNRRQFYKLLLYQNTNHQKIESKSIEILEMAQKRKVPIQYTTRKELDILLLDRPHQNVALEVSKFEPPVISSPPHGSKIIIFPVNLLDPQNLGSIIRTSTFYGCSALVTTLKDSCDYTPIVSKASAGCMETFENLFRTKSALQFLKNAKSEGFKIIGTGLSSSSNPKISSDFNYADKIILLLGNEGKGLNQEILSICDFNITIPTIFNSNPVGLDSLNVSVATGILLDRLRNQRLMN